MDGWLWIAFYAVMFFVMMRYGCGAHMMGHGHAGHADHEGDQGHGSGSGDAPKRRGGKFMDPVCGMEVPRDEGYGKMYKGIPYRFCSRGCLDRFDVDAEQYVGHRSDYLS